MPADGRTVDSHLHVVPSVSTLPAEETKKNPTNTILYLRYQHTSGLRDTPSSDCEQQSDIRIKEEGSQHNMVTRLSRTQEIGFHVTARLLRDPYSLEER